MLNYLVLSLILLDVALNVVGQLSLRHGMKVMENFSLSLPSLASVFARAAINPFIILGLCCYGMGFMVWLIVLAKAEVSYAYPMISLGYVFTAILGWLLLGEHVTATRFVGILTICLGVFINARS